MIREICEVSGAKIDIEDYPDQKSMFEVAKKLKVEGIDKKANRGKIL